jgi:hypothetical protein
LKKESYEEDKKKKSMKQIFSNAIGKLEKHWALFPIITILLGLTITVSTKIFPFVDEKIFFLAILPVLPELIILTKLGIKKKWKELIFSALLFAFSLFILFLSLIVLLIHNALNG